MSKSSSRRSGRILAVAGLLVAASVAAVIWIDLAASSRKGREKSVAELERQLQLFGPSKDAREVEPETLREEACNALAALKAEAAPAVPLLLHTAQSDPATRVRRRAISALGEIGAPASSARPVLLRMLKELPDPGMRAAIADAIPKLARADAALTAELIDLLARQDSGLAGHALTMLGQFGRRSELPESVLLDVLARETNSARRVRFLAAVGEALPKKEEVVRALETALSEKNDLVRLGAVQTLAGMGPAAEEAVPALLKLLHETKDSSVTIEEAQTLRRLTNRKHELHRTILRTLGTLGPAANRAVPVLIQEYADSNNAFRFEAAAARVKIDANCAAIRGVFTAALDQDASDLLALAMAKLGDVAPVCPDTIDLVLRELRSNESSRRSRAINLLPYYGTNAWAAFDALTEASTDTNRSVNRLARMALTNLHALRAPSQTSTVP